MRFKIARGKMLVIDAENHSAMRDVLLIHDTENDTVGVQLIGDSPIKGYTFFVERGSFEAVRQNGKPTDRLKVF